MIGTRATSLAISLLLAWSMLVGAGGARAATATGPRLGIHGDGITRFVVDLSDTVTFKVSTMAEPYRVVIDAPDLEWGGVPAVTKPWGSVNGLRGEAGRVVLDLRKPAVVKSAFIIPPRDGQSWRLVVDLAETTREGFLATVEGAAPVLKPPPGVKAAAPKPVTAPTPAPKPVAVPVEEARPEPAAEAVANPVAPAAPAVASPPAATRIVVTSPNAAPSPEAANPAPVPAQAAAEKAARGPGGQPILSAPMPPPPERPAQPPAAPAVAAAPVTPPPPTVQPAPQPAPAVESVAKARDGVPVIVIDPGHGGVDPGATGVSGIYEKHITLAMARELKAALEKGGRYRVHLTRDRDVFIRLRDRVAIARQHGADLFISLHADAVQNPQIRGLSVYTLSQNASDSEAQALAEKENKADLIAGIDLSHESADVAGILIDLAQRETMNRSAGFASEVVDEVGQEMDLLGNTHRFAGFAVLKAPDVPAILVEMGYLSNEFEEKQLRQPQYRARLAKSIAKAAERFFPLNLKAKRP